MSQPNEPPQTMTSNEDLLVQAQAEVERLHDQGWAKRSFASAMAELLTEPNPTDPHKG